jgi:hypothetical protein
MVVLNLASLFEKLSTTVPLFLSNRILFDTEVLKPLPEGLVNAARRY